MSEGPVGDGGLDPSLSAFTHQPKHPPSSSSFCFFRSSRPAGCESPSSDSPAARAAGTEVMHIKNPQAALLSNHEVLLHLRSQEAEYSGADGTHRARTKPSHLKHMLRDGLSYLQSADYSASHLAAARPHRPATLYMGQHSLFRVLAPSYRLNKVEYLQIYNLRPSTQVGLQLIVEEADARFSEAQLADILSLVQSVFDQEEASIPAGAEDQILDKIPNKLLGASKKRRKPKRERL